MIVNICWNLYKILILEPFGCIWNICWLYSVGTPFCLIHASSLILGPRVCRLLFRKSHFRRNFMIFQVVNSLFRKHVQQACRHSFAKFNSRYWMGLLVGLLDLLVGSSRTASSLHATSDASSLQLCFSRKSECTSFLLPKYFSPIPLTPLKQIFKWLWYISKICLKICCVTSKYSSKSFVLQDKI